MSQSSTGDFSGDVLPGAKLPQEWHGSQGSALQVQLPDVDVSAENQLHLKRFRSLMHYLVTQRELLISDYNLHSQFRESFLASGPLENKGTVLSLPHPIFIFPISTS